MARAKPSQEPRGDRSRLALRILEWPIVWSLGGLALWAGYVGFARHFAAVGEPKGVLDLLHLTLQLFLLNSGDVSPPVPWQLQLARLLAQEQLQLIRIYLMRDHVVICGLGRKGLHLARALRSDGKSVVVIEKDAHNDALEECRRLGVAILIGDATDPQLLAEARSSRASRVVSLCRDDAVNAEVAVRVREQLVNSKRIGRSAVECVIHVVDPELCELMRDQEILFPQTDSFRVSFFNSFRIGAWTMLEKFSPLGSPGEETDHPPHLLIVGLGYLGESFLAEAARRWWYAHGQRSRLRVTVVDQQARDRVDVLSLRYPRLPEACNVRAIEVDVRSPEFRRDAFLSWSGDGKDVTSVFVCLDDESLALSTALALHERLLESSTPIVVRMGEDRGLSQLLQGEGGSGRYRNLSAFGLLDLTCTPDSVTSFTREMLARKIHKEYVKTREAQGDTPERNRNLVPWEELDEHYRESNRLQGEHIQVKLARVGCAAAHRRDWGAPLFEFRLDEIELLAKVEHDRFVEERLAQGWRYGPPPRNESKKTNPTLVPWEQLSEADKDVDRETVRELPHFLAEVGFAVRRAVTVQEFRGACDASAAARIPDTTCFVAASDEEYLLRVYDSSQPGRSVAELDVTDFLEPADRQKEPDIEGCAVIGDRIYWIGSHGRNKKGEAQENRQRLFATEIRVTSGRPELRTIGKPYKELLNEATSSPDLAEFQLAAAAALPPEEPGGLNLEGLASTPEGHLLVGLRNPIPGGRALVLRIENPDDVVSGNDRAKVGRGGLLDLGGRGIRALEGTPDGRYYLLAGASDDTKDFALFSWDGRNTTPTLLLAGPLLNDLNPEELIAGPQTGGVSTLQLFSDDGDRLVGGRKCKKADASARSFRVATLKLVT
jgi:hypothetical protein